MGVGAEQGCSIGTRMVPAAFRHVTGCIIQASQPHLAGLWRAAMAKAGECHERVLRTGTAAVQRCQESIPVYAGRVQRRPPVARGCRLRLVSTAQHATQAWHSHIHSTPLHATPLHSTPQRTSRLLRLSTSGVPPMLGRGVRLLMLLPPLSTLPPLSALTLERRRWVEAGAGLASLPTDARRAYMPGAVGRRAGRVTAREEAGLDTQRQMKASQ